MSRTAFLCALLAAVFVTGLGTRPLLAQDQGDLTETERRLQALREQISQDERRLTENTQAEQASLETLNDLDREIAIRRELTSSYQNRMMELAQSSDSLQKALEGFEQDISTLQAQYRHFAVHAYKYGRLHDLALILSASSINQMLIRIRYLNRFADQRREKLQAIADATTALEDRRAELAEARVQTQLLLREAEEEKKRMERLQQSRRTVIQQLRSQRTDLTENLQKKRTAASELENRMRALIAAQAERRRSQATNDPAADVAFAELSGSFLQNKGRLPWPAQGAVVEPYGEIVNPVHGTRTPNPGILIATRAQEEVRAIFEGTVLSVSVLPEFGIFVALQHGEYQSVYSNFSLVYVTEGDAVSAGQVIGRAGTADEPKQEGVFFGLFKNGSPVDPSPWLRTR